MKPNNQKDRNSLKEYFQKGKTPTEQQFAELIDSTPNLVEDGQVIRTSSGWAFYPQQDGSIQLGMYTEQAATGQQPPVWSIAITPEKNLIISNAHEEAVWETSPDKSVTLHGSLTVEDTITAPKYKIKGGAGKEEYLNVPADRQWHDLPLNLSAKGFGCCVYQIHASYQEASTKLCRLTCVTAIWQNYKVQRILSAEQHWWGWTGDIRFRWQQQENGEFHLQLRSHKSLPADIHCLITETFKG